MADRRSKYYFSNESDYEKAKNHIRELMYQDYWDSDKIYFEGYYGGEYLISIMTECSNPILAASLCEEHHGQFRIGRTLKNCGKLHPVDEHRLKENDAT